MKVIGMKEQYYSFLDTIIVEKGGNIEFWDILEDQTQKYLSYNPTQTNKWFRPIETNKWFRFYGLDRSMFIMRLFDSGYETMKVYGELDGKLCVNYNNYPHTFDISSQEFSPLKEGLDWFILTGFKKPPYSQLVKITKSGFIEIPGEIYSKINYIVSDLIHYNGLALYGTYPAELMEEVGGEDTLVDKWGNPYEIAYGDPNFPEGEPFFWEDRIVESGEYYYVSLSNYNNYRIYRFSKEKLKNLFDFSWEAELNEFLTGA